MTFTALSGERVPTTTSRQVGTCQEVTNMLLISLEILLVLATLALIAVGAILGYRKRFEDVGEPIRDANRYQPDDSYQAYESYDSMSNVRLGELVSEMAQAYRDQSALARLRLEAEKGRGMAETIG